MEAEEEEVTDMIRPLLRVQRYLKELGHFLNRHDEAQLQKRKWQHLNWAYNVWFPQQRRAKRQASRSRHTKERQSVRRAPAEDSGNRMY